MYSCARYTISERGAIRCERFARSQLYQPDTTEGWRPSASSAASTTASGDSPACGSSFAMKNGKIVSFANPGGNGFGGFYNPYFFAPPIIAGSWYQRPYPYHFDYYRSRWGAPQGGYGGEPGVATPDCPCATPPPAEVVE